MATPSPCPGEGDGTIRRLACEEIGLLGRTVEAAPAAAASVARLLEDNDPEVVGTAVDSLRRIGRGAHPALPALRRLLDSRVHPALERPIKTAIRVIAR